jgi:hypothetical protein
MGLGNHWKTYKHFQKYEGNIQLRDKDIDENIKLFLDNNVKKCRLDPLAKNWLLWTLLRTSKIQK